MKTLVNIFYYKDPVKIEVPGSICIVERVNGVLQHRKIFNPKIKFHVSKPEYLAKHAAQRLKFVDVNEVEEFECDYLTMYGAMYKRILEMDPDKARVAKYTKQFKWAYNNHNTYGFKKMHSHPMFHGSDIDLVDYYIKQWIEENDGDIDPSHPITKDYFDIEVDIIECQGFPEEEKAEWPCNAVSYFNSESGTLLGGFLRNAVRPNPKLIEAEKNIEAFKERFMKKYQYEPHLKLRKFDTLKHLEIEFFDTEEELLLWLFNLINVRYKPNIISAWNAKFDIKTCMGRLKKFGFDPLDIMCPQEFHDVKAGYYFDDMKAADISLKRDSFDISSFTLYEDQMLVFAKSRVTEGKRESYQLDSILYSELQANKVNLEPYTIKNVAYEDPELFFEYSLVDTFRLSQLEDKVGDYDLLYAMMMITYTRFNKVLTKTISIRNLAAKFFAAQGSIVSNNQNQNQLVRDKSVKAKFRGALTFKGTLKPVNCGKFLKH